MLSELSSGTAKIEALRGKAATILKHYPNDMDIEIAARQAPTVFATKFFDADS
ncbi:BPSL0761 family protein [Paraburkholderia sp. MM5496-R1]|uniref:BPSL0761 family protein n=1 Tax=Paraburkholderia sp. MM5496-R1 TaxID=2991065 RepID=UPI003D1D5344